MGLFTSPEERYQALKVNRMHGINSAAHIYYEGDYLEPCVANPFDPNFASCGDPPPCTPPEWLLTRSIIKLIVVACLVIAVAAVSFIIMRGTFPLRPGSDGGPGPGPGPGPTPPITSTSDSPGGPQNANPSGWGAPEHVYT